MKQKKINLKLTLNKTTVADLKSKEMGKVVGGITAFITCGETLRCGTGVRCTNICACTDYPCTLGCPV